MCFFNGCKDCFEAQYAMGLSVLAVKYKVLRSGECEGQVLLFISLTRRLKCAGAQLCINSAPTADRYLGCTVPRKLGELALI
jgi:hypothetical protein